MSFKQKFKELTAMAGFSTPENVAETEDFDLIKEEAENKAIAAEKELADWKFEQLSATAERFAMSEIAANKMFPAEKKAFVSLFVQAATDDALSPLASGSRLDNLQTIQSKRASHKFCEEIFTP